MSGKATRRDIKVTNRPKLGFSDLGTALCAALFLFCTTSAVKAAIVGTGEISPANPATWVSGTIAHIGEGGSGTVSVDGGSSLKTWYGYVGYTSVGTVTVTGAGSSWTNSDYLYIGTWGAGTLNILGGGQVTNNSFDSYLGYYPGSTGSVTVSGVGSKWTTTKSSVETFYIGYGGSGTLNIEAGGQVISFSSELGWESGSSGTVTVTGTGSKWTSGYIWFHGSRSTLNIKSGGQVSSTQGDVGGGSVTVSGINSKWINSLVLFLDAGTMNIESGGFVSNTTGYLGHYAGSIATVTVNGAGSMWTNSSELYVGEKGNGVLNIKSGGQVSNTTGYIGYDNFTSGTAKVTGSGSTWTNKSDLYVGFEGSGTLTVTDGGVVTAKTLYASMNRLSGNGTITTKGAVLDADLVFDASHGPQHAISFGTGGTLNLNMDGTVALGVGYKGNGTLRITDGVVVASTTGFLGYDSTTSIGTATVSGTGSMWNNSGILYVGYTGSGTLNIEAGGQVSNSVAYIGKNPVSISSVTVSGVNSKWSNSSIFVGDVGSGTLNIGNGSISGGLVTVGTLTLANGFLGRGTCNINNGGVLRAVTVTKGSGVSTFNWNDGTIQNSYGQANLTISNNLNLKLAATGTHAFSIDAGRTGTINAVLSDATSDGTLAKKGTGALVLTGVNTYSGQTTVEAGRFKVTGSILKTSGIDVSAGATLELAKPSGSATAGSLPISNAGTVLISAGSQTVGTISGTGVTQVSAGTLTAKSIVQDSLFIGTTGAGASGESAVNQVPEPGTMALLFVGAVGVFLYRRFSTESLG